MQGTRHSIGRIVFLTTIGTSASAITFTFSAHTAFSQSRATRTFLRLRTIRIAISIRLSLLRILFDLDGLRERGLRHLIGRHGFGRKRIERIAQRDWTFRRHDCFFLSLRLFLFFIATTAHNDENRQ